MSFKNSYLLFHAMLSSRVHEILSTHVIGFAVEYLRVGYLDEWSVLRVVMRYNWIISCPVIGYDECPPPPITVVLLRLVEQVTVKEKSISSL